MPLLKQQPDQALAGFIALSQAAKHCPYSAEYLSLLARKGKLKAFKINRDWVTTPEAVLEYVKRQKRKHRPGKPHHSL